MEVEALGETALILRRLSESPIAVAQKLEQSLPGLLDVVPCYETVALYFEGTPPNLDELVKGLRVSSTGILGKRHRIPVCYDLGLDLEAAAIGLGISAEELIQIHCEREYQCAAVGFTPGFAYLGDLNPRIAGLPRLSSPRSRVEAGSLGITGKQTAVYPSESPGGWNLIGRTPLTLVDVEDSYFPISAGEFVQFFPIGNAEFERLKGVRL